MRNQHCNVKRNCTCYVILILYINQELTNFKTLSSRSHLNLSSRQYTQGNSISCARFFYKNHIERSPINRTISSVSCQREKHKNHKLPFQPQNQQRYSGNLICIPIFIREQTEQLLITIINAEFCAEKQAMKSANQKSILSIKSIKIK